MVSCTVWKVAGSCEVHVSQWLLFLFPAERHSFTFLSCFLRCHHWIIKMFGIMLFICSLCLLTYFKYLHDLYFVKLILNTSFTKSNLELGKLAEINQLNFLPIGVFIAEWSQNVPCAIESSTESSQPTVHTNHMPDVPGPQLAVPLACWIQSYSVFAGC